MPLALPSVRAPAMAEEVIDPTDTGQIILLGCLSGVVSRVEGVCHTVTNSF